MLTIPIICPCWRFSSRTVRLYHSFAAHSGWKKLLINSDLKAGKQAIASPTSHCHSDRVLPSILPEEHLLSNMSVHRFDRLLLRGIEGGGISRSHQECRVRGPRSFQWYIISFMINLCFQLNYSICSRICDPHAPVGQLQARRDGVLSNGGSRM